MHSGEIEGEREEEELSANSRSRNFVMDEFKTTNLLTSIWLSADFDAFASFLSSSPPLTSSQQQVQLSNGVNRKLTSLFPSSASSN